MTETHYFSYPQDGSNKELSSGILKINYNTGAIIRPKGQTDEKLTDSLQNHTMQYIHSLLISTDKPITIRMDEHDAIPILPGKLIPLRSLQFSDIQVKLTSTTNIFILASTDPDGIIRVPNTISINRSEELFTISTDKDTHFTEEITLNNHETENLTGLISNKIYIRGINIQSKQPLKYQFIVWDKDTFSDTNINKDTYKEATELDMTSSPAFRIASAGQYYHNLSKLGVVYEDKDETYELHCSLQNFSTTAKNAGATGEVQIDIKYSPRL